jgi:hypothetical protein
MNLRDYIYSSYKLTKNDRLALSNWLSLHERLSKDTSIEVIVAFIEYELSHANRAHIMQRLTAKLTASIRSLIQAKHREVVYAQTQGKRKNFRTAADENS